MADGTRAGSAAPRRFDPERVADQIRLSALWFAGSALWEAVLTVILPLIVLADVGNAKKAVALSLIATTGTLLASAVHPVAGWASDVTRTRFGRRRPYLVTGAVGAAAGLVWMAFGRGYAELVAAVLLLQLGYNVALAAYQAYIPEISPADGRGKASGFLGLMSSLGALVGAIGAVLLVHGNTYRVMLAALAVLYLAAVAITVWGLPEAPPPPPPAAPVADRRPARGYRDFIWVIVTRALVMLAFYTMLTYLAYFLKDVVHLATYSTDTSYVVAVTILAAAVSTLSFGRRSDVVGRRAIVSAAGALMGLAAAGFLVLRSLPAILAVGFVFGLGYGAYISVDWALVTDVLPDRAGVARDMGFWGLAITVPQVLAPVIAGAFFLLLHGSNAAYLWTFGLTCIYALVGSALVWQVRGVR